MMIWVACVLISATTASDVAVNEVYNTLPCDTDRDCPITSFCFQSECMKCVNCTKRNRQEAPLRCARQKEECGPCLDGFVSRKTFRPSSSRCFEIDANADAIRMSPELDTKSVNVGWFGLAGMCLITLLGYVSYRCYNKRNNVVTTNAWNHEMGSNSDIASPPPPYQEECGHMSDNGSVSYSFQLRVTEHPSEHKTMAVPFQPPVYHEGGTVAFSPPIYNNESVEHVDNVVNNAVDATDEFDSAGDIHDENTQPSNWTPGSAYIETDEIDETENTDFFFNEIEEIDNDENTKISPPTKKRKVEKEIEPSKDS